MVLRLDLFDVCPAGFNRLGDVSFDVIGREGGPTNLKVVGQKRVRFAHGRYGNIVLVECTELIE